MNTLFEEKKQEMFEIYNKAIKYYHEKKYIEATKYLKLAAELGLDSAQSDLGYFYERGLGVERNILSAKYWYEKAAEQGLAEAEYCLGWLYEKGLIDKKKDYTKAMDWYEKAAGHEFASAQNKMGSLYENGLGVIKDLEKALFWYNKVGKNHYCSKILSSLNGRKVLVIDNISELINEHEDINKQEYGAVKICPIENFDDEAHTLYSLEDIEKIKYSIESIFEDVEKNKGDNELKIFMQIYVKLAQLISYDEKGDSTQLKDDSNLNYTCRNMIGGILRHQSVCSGYAEILRNVLACRNIESKIIRAQNHVYNQVKINNKWYYVDLTNDVNNILKKTKLRWCLKGKQSFIQYSGIGHKDLPCQIIKEAEEDYPEEELTKVYKEVLDCFTNQKHGDIIQTQSKLSLNNDRGETR